MKMPDAKAWAIFTPEGNARMWSTFQPHVQKLADAEGLTVTPLYDKQALIDLLEEAAELCEKERVAHLMFKNYQAAMALANARDDIRKLTEKL